MHDSAVTPSGGARVLSVRVLGSLDVTVGGRPIGIVASKPRSVLAILACQANTVVSIDQLIDAVWDGRPPPKAKATLHTYISALRKALQGPDPDEPNPIETVERGYRLHLADHELDLTEFRRRTSRAEQAITAGDLAGAHDELRRATTLLRGPVLAEFDHIEQVRLFAIDMGERRCWALEQRIELDLGEDPSASVAELRAIVADNPYEERFWGQLIRSLYYAGNQAEALRTYEKLRTTLADDLGLDPSPDLQAIEAAILEQRLPPPSGPQRHRTHPRRPTVPTAATSFIGRADQLARIDRLLDHHRLVTLVGAGGSGKTRLAAEAASRVTPRFAGRTWWVELAEVDDSRHIIDAIAAAIGSIRRRQADLYDIVADDLDEAPTLLVIDNCEHVIDEAALVIERLVRDCAELTVLATSREALAVPAERIEEVEPLPVAGVLELAMGRSSEPTDAADLFIDRATAASGGLAPASGSLALIESVCAELDGIPLAIELAASLVAGMSVEEIADRLIDRFELLTQHRRTSRYEHRTLLSVVEWSYDLLDEDEQRLFAMLGTFKGSFTTTVAEALVAPFDADAARLADLVRKSMVRRDGEVGGRSRFRMLTTLRTYALDRLAEMDERAQVEDRFVTIHVEQAERRRYGMLTTAATWFEALAPDLLNFQVAIDLALDRDVDQALRLIDAFSWYFNFLGSTDRVGDWLHEQLAGGALDDRQRALALSSSAALEMFSGSYGSTADLAESALVAARAAGDIEILAGALVIRGATAIFEGNSQRAAECFAECQPMLEQLGDDNNLAAALAFWGVAYRRAGAFDEARRCLDTAYGLFSDQGDDRGLSLVMMNLARIAQADGDLDRAEPLCDEACVLADRSLDSIVIALSSLFRGRMASDRGELALAVEHFEKGLHHARILGNRVIGSSCIEWLGIIGLENDHWRELAELAGFTELYRRAPATADPLIDLDNALARCRRRLSDDEYVAARDAGRRLTLDQAADLARRTARP
ncbi:MAG: winged helix-turn-helix domain-containing protein [Acidimicrobiia bacterium]|nr:winged helix-turn-helix domain-containing protein [Acidimicrobiia bacterium]